jgi:putative ABC transport system permease protein
MLRNYFVIAWRNIRKHKLYSTVNIIGLSIGITSCILIGLYIWSELQYDKFNSKADRIARVTMEYNMSGTVQKAAVTGTKVGPQLMRTFPQIEAYARTYKSPRVIANGSKVFDEKNVLYADADFFRIFSFHMLQGNATTALDAPYKIVLTESTARKYFGEVNPIGKTLRINDARDYEVTGITKDVPLQSQIQYDMVVSFTSLNASKSEEWWSANYITYLLQKPAARLTDLQQQITQYMKKVTKDELKATGNDYLTFRLEPLLKVHLHSALPGLEPNGNIIYIYVMGIIALLIALIACVNYTNLATAQAAGRSTEIGIRKVLGAQKKALFSQFIGEAFILTIISLVIAFAAASALMPLLNTITGKDFTTAMLWQPFFLGSLVLFGIGISLLAGAYPAFVLSNTGLVKILKANLQVSSSGRQLKKYLIVLQFVISVFLIIATIVVLKQMHYIRNKNLGYDREQVVVLPVDGKVKNNYDNLKKALAAHPGVQSITGAYEDPTNIEWGDGIRAHNGTAEKEISVNAIPVDLDFIRTMGMQIIAGTDFVNSDFSLQDTSNDYRNYRSSFILNEKAANELGWTASEAIGKTVSRGSPGEIKAVVKNFHFTSLHNPIGPLVLFLDTTQVHQLFVKINGQNIQGTLQALERIWKERVPHRPFNYHFLDEDFNTLYTAEERTGKLFSLFSGLAVILACLGLFALTAYTTIQRTKEIGIRKVLGAGIDDITILISKDFMKLVGIAILIASPLGWMAGKRWLQDFAYQTQLNAWIFVAAGIIAVLIALITVSIHAIKAALANPVKSLRTE